VEKNPMILLRHSAVALALVFSLLAVSVAWTATEGPRQWQREWPRTDFSRTSVDFKEIQSGGPPKDGIPSIDQPRFVPLVEATDLQPEEAVISLVVAGEARAYPLRILMWHEIVNDVVAGVPVAVTYCPLCNTSIVFDRRLDGRILDFGTTGKLRHSDLVMYDRQTESWWQQFGGDAIVGELTGRSLEMLPSRLESFASFRERAPAGRVLIPDRPGSRAYGTNPYVGYDRATRPFLFAGPLPEGVAAMMRVVAVGERAWALPLVRERELIEADDLRIHWRPGQVSALDTADITQGAEVGNVVVQRRGEDVPYVVTFAFAFFAFHPDGVLHTQDGPIRQRSSGE
jgi:hypothetical protein